MENRLVEGFAPDDHVVTQKTDDGGQKSASLVVFEDTRPSFVAVCDERIRGSEIDPNDGIARCLIRGGT
jgi:hypothetical protein